MSYKKLLTHRCDIFRLEAKENGAPTYGLPAASIVKKPDYSEVPIDQEVPCYFTEKNQSVVQGEPAQAVFQSYLVHFLPNEDIRLNDKVVWDGVEFVLQKPRKIRNHHQEVTAVGSVRL
ncbi:DUF3599 family protein [Domibacillus tundrae]|uniref:DUF3599 family protein n=1 Tax=Domibacillus tundrae TaxID=1587527 RepID=UPI000617D00E|nr:DUF3599 family protein [Domibacillus tundrae]